MLDDPMQLEAIARCCNVKNRVVAVTGEAGTGKTTILKNVYEALTEHGYRVALCAPTGKAAKRIQEATGIAAVTIHRLLEYTHPGEPDPKTGKVVGYSYPRRDKRNPLEIDVVLGDEYAMVNHETHRNLFDSLPPGGCIRVFGDINQLAPIEPASLADKPSPFQELLTKFSGVVLTTNHRQNSGSGIAENGKRILKGFCPSRRSDFVIKITEEPVRELEDIVFTYREEKGVDFSSLDHQIITPSNKTWVGTLKLNQVLQRIFRAGETGGLDVPRNSWVKDPLRLFVGDKVVNTSNIYELEFFNGEVGIVKEVTEFGEIAIDTGDRMVVVPPSIEYQDNEGITKTFDPRKSIDLAYALTTHKTQGSEYKHVIYVLNKSSYFVQTRANLYTGCSRAREFVTLITDTRSFQHSVTTTKTVADKKRKEAK